MSWENLRNTLALWIFGGLKVPLILYCRPRVTTLSQARVIIRIPLRRRTRNHLRSMYFGVLAVGADCAGGILAMFLIRKSRQPISLVFKTFSAEFLRRPEGDVDFECCDGAAITDLVHRAATTGERVETTVLVTATCPKIDPRTPVARMQLTLSLKLRT